jgi:hypothetical protein
VSAVSTSTTREDAHIKETTVTFEEFNSIVGTGPADDSGISFDETTTLYKKEHCPQPNEDDVWKALLALRNACDLRTESGTVILFHALFEACKRVDRKDYKRHVVSAHREGVGFDVTILLAERILEVMREREPVQIFWDTRKDSLVDWDRQIAEKKRPRS